MINSMLAGLDTLLLVLFAAGALAGALLMIVLRQPMRVATALISTMVFLGGIYGLLGVHFIAAFQVLSYVGAVMVFMVYVIMLLDPRDPAIQTRFSRMLVPGVIGFVVLIFLLIGATWTRTAVPHPGEPDAFGLQRFAAIFLRDYWLHFELTSVLLVAAIVAAVAVVKLHRRDRG